MRARILAGAAVLTIVASGAALAAAALPQAKALAIMHERHEGMENIGKNSKAIHRALDGSTPDLAAIRTSAHNIRSLSAKASGWFVRGTGPEIGKTGAKPEIWENPADFVSKMRDFQKEARAFDTAARGGDLDLIRAQYDDLGQTCKACHNKYRSEMHH